MANSIQVGDLHSKSSALVRIRMLLGLDRAVLFTVLARGWSSVAGLLTLLLVARFLSPDEQGYYYTFGSLAALQIVFELGFSFVIQQMASHERALLDISPDGLITGVEKAHARLASVLQKTVRWYTVAAVMLFLGLLSAGMYFFSTHSHPSYPVSWHLPWVLVSFAASLTFQIDPIFAFLEGCGYVPEVARTRFWQAFTGTFLAWASLVTHHGLFAPAMVILGQAVTGSACLWVHRYLLLGLWKHPAGIHRIEWFTEVWPFQWRIAVSWISGYFIFQLFNPVLFAYWGPVAAGQMGMSLSIGTAIMGIGIAWISTKSAPFGALVARKQYAELDRLFFRALRQSFIVCVSGCLAVFAVTIYLYADGLPFARRLLNPWQFSLLLLAIAVNHIVFAEAIYLRAHKQEKFLMVSVITAFLVALSTYCLGRAYGATGMMLGYLVVKTFVGLGLGTWTFGKYRRVWHAE
jgi:O-antigen/teichoic acid export membrane protein